MRALLCLICTTLVLALLVSRWFGAPPASHSAEFVSLRAENERLKHRLSSCEAITRVSGGRGDATAAATAASTANTNGATTATTNGGGPVQVGEGVAKQQQQLMAELLDLHSHWDWQSIAFDMLQPFVSITSRMVDDGVKACFENGTMYCTRLQVLRGELYITDYRAVFFDR